MSKLPEIVECDCGAIIPIIDAVQQAYQQGREDEREAMARWIRACQEYGFEHVAKVIERGDHLKGTEHAK